MKCDQAQQWMLLADSGELRSKEASELETHLSSCAECRQYRKTVSRIMADAREKTTVDGPSSAVLARIRDAAEQTGGETHGVLWRTSVQIFAYAAGIVLMAGVWFLLSDVNTTRNTERHITTADLRVEHIGHINTIVSMLSDESYYDRKAAEALDETPQTPDIRELARELLIMEGLAAENYVEDTIMIPDVESWPIDLQSSSRSAFQATECG